MTPDQWAARWNQLIEDGTIDQLTLFDSENPEDQAKYNEAKDKCIALLCDEIYTPSGLTRLLFPE